MSEKVTRTVEQGNGYKLVVTEDPRHGFHQSGDYQNYCKNCAAHIWAHFRRAMRACPNTVDVESVEQPSPR